MSVRKKEGKKVDYAALNSPFMHIPNMDVRAARMFLDLGIGEIYQLKGRDPSAIFAEAKRKRPDIPPELFKFVSKAVEFAESE